ncbi:FHA domain-containing protein [Crenothrix polyspora]|uniref:FHA domain-containing protein n=1 Tax=Crenothrix polyspora TaxID=360316 RepID=A0A1R4GYS2_9GAMM|nr:FHA domain-containing protein [Crenothrix polyspora]SJM89115.1 FHA domain-containing protein [Crenothrix polyspora]
MQDDKTIIKKNLSQNDDDLDRTVIFQSGLIVSITDGNDGQTSPEKLFPHGFTVGRAQDNSIAIQNEKISRHHLEVKKEQGDWWIYDLNSANGIYLHDRQIQHKERLHLPASVALGKTGITLKIQSTHQVDNEQTQIVKSITTTTSIPPGFHAESPQGNLSKEAIKQRLLSKDEATDAGDFTRMVRIVINEDRVHRSKNYKKSISVLGILFLVSAALVGYQQTKLTHARDLALGMFYDIKTLEVSLSQSEITFERSAEILDQTLKAVASDKFKVEQERIRAEQQKVTEERIRLAQERMHLKDMKAKYQVYVQEAESLKFRLPFSSNYEEKLIAKVAREFGESELEVPDGFVAEVKRYIKFWQSTPRMRNAIAVLEKNNYGPTILSALDKEGLPTQFLYLPMQESSYNSRAIGPETRYGIAKGAWQFLDSTGKDYGLKPGPMANIRVYDEQDDRFNFALASRAGAKYIKYIFSTEAQASGLLVIASYNFGENRVRSWVKKMPDNPRDKNFWKFIQQYKSRLPKETYDYVFYIFSAAVIGEDPKYFGFNFKSPTALTMAKSE